MNPKYSVIIITFNQENIISRTIDSILFQKEFVFEIIVSDDCSTDSTWEVIMGYQTRFPNLIKPYRNKVNMGIFGHYESTWNKVSGDVVFVLAGDDVFCDKLFEKANILINNHKIDFKNDLFTLNFDYKQVTPNGKELVFRNSMIEKYDPISLKIRNLISTRGTGVSKKVLNKFFPVNKNIGIYADGLIDIQFYLFSENNYYSRYVGSIYYSSIGISSRTPIDAGYRSKLLFLEELTKVISLSNKDLLWIQYLIKSLEFRLQANFKNLYCYFAYLFLGVGLSFGFNLFFIEFLRFLAANIKLLKIQLTKL